MLDHKDKTTEKVGHMTVASRHVCVCHELSGETVCLCLAACPSRVMPQLLHTNIDLVIVVTD